MPSDSRVRKPRSALGKGPRPLAEASRSTALSRRTEAPGPRPTGPCQCKFKLASSWGAAAGEPGPSTAADSQTLPGLPAPALAGAAPWRPWARGQAVSDTVCAAGGGGVFAFGQRHRSCSKFGGVSGSRR
jgi:hypothetical protein